MQSKLPMHLQQEMRSTHEIPREPLPIASDEEWAMPDARREVAGRTER